MARSRDSTQTGCSILRLKLGFRADRANCEDCEEERMGNHNTLSAEDTDTVRERLLNEKFFYHGTLDICLNGIRKDALRPNQRFCTWNFVCRVALRAAEDRAWEGKPVYLAIQQPNRPTPVLLRTPASSFLNRNFDLDLEFDPYGEVRGLLHEQNDTLTLKQFDDFVSKFGCFACYDAIPASELDLHKGDFRTLCKSRPMPKPEDLEWGSLSL
jgi:hypothetical protein